MRSLFVILSLLLPLACQAGIYTWTDSSGRTHYSDTPVAEAEPLLIAPVSIVSKPKETRFEIRYTSYNGAMVVNGKVNGTPVRFVVDTGASLIIIPPAVAERAGIDTSGARQVRLQTANGIIEAPLVTLAEVVADDVARENMDAAIQQVSATPDLGLLGMPFFSDHKVTIDHAHQVIVLEPK